MGERYVKVRKFATKTKGAQEAHEAIRPTYMENETVNGTGQEQKLYELITETYHRFTDGRCGAGENNGYYCNQQQ